MPSTSVHTMFMRFPLDLVYLDRDLRIVKTASALRTNRFSMGGRGARTVLELPAGFLERTPLTVGQQLRMEAADATAPHPGA